MALRRLLLSTLVVVPFLIAARPTAGSPAGHRRAHRGADQAGVEGGHRDEHRDVIAYDASVEEPTRIPEIVIWVNDSGNAIRTATESVLLLPTRLALPLSSSDAGTRTAMSEPTTTMTMTTTMAWPSTEKPAVTSSSATTTLGGEESSSATSPPSSSTTAASASVPTASSSGGGSKETPPPTTDDKPTLSSSSPPQATSTQTLPGGPVNGGTGSSDGPGAAKLFGVSYAPYRANHQCKSQQDIDDDFRRFRGSYGLVRIYGTDCDQVRKVYSAAKANGVKLFLGIWDLASLQDEVNLIIAGIQSDWNIVHSVSVGNECVNSGRAGPAQVLRALRTARPMLRAAGYTGPVVTVDTFMAVEANPQLCDESDYCAINAHPFFDGTIPASQAGQWLLDTVKRVKSVLSTPKVVFITETGWPIRGIPNRMAVPSLANQKTALDSIKEAFASNPSHVILFSAFNDLWKKREIATFNADQFWGIGGAVSDSDLRVMSSH